MLAAAVAESSPAASARATRTSGSSAVGMGGISPWRSEKRRLAKPPNGRASVALAVRFGKDHDSAGPGIQAIPIAPPSQARDTPETAEGRPPGCAAILQNRPFPYNRKSPVGRYNPQL